MNGSFDYGFWPLVVINSGIFMVCHHYEGYRPWAHEIRPDAYRNVRNNAHTEKIASIGHITSKSTRMFASGVFI